MKIFQSIQIYFAMLGIRLPQQNQKYSFNVKSLLVLFQLFVPIIFYHGYQIHKSQNFEEYTKVFYETATVAIATFDFIILVWWADKLYKFIAHFEIIIQKSKWNFVQ